MTLRQATEKAAWLRGLGCGERLGSFVGLLQDGKEWKVLYRTKPPNFVASYCVSSTALTS